MTDPSIVQLITLLEGVPFERELEKLRSKYKTKRLGKLFRTTKIVNDQPYGSYWSSSTSSVNGNGPQNPTSLFSAASHPDPPDKELDLIRPKSTSVPISNSLNLRNQTWALKTKHAAAPVDAPQPLSADPDRKSPEIFRNRHGQRVDPPLPYDMNEITRVKKIHMCNVHFLRGDCPYESVSNISSIILQMRSKGSCEDVGPQIFICPLTSLWPSCWSHLYRRFLTVFELILSIVYSVPMIILTSPIRTSYKRSAILVG